MEDVIMMQRDGKYIVLDLVARMIQERTREELEPQALRDFADAIIYDPFGRYHSVDQEQWFMLLEDAMKKDYALYCVLLITRFAGTKIVDGGAYWKLEPIYKTQLRYSWWTPERWTEYRSNVLMPYADKIKALLFKQGR